MRHLLLAIVLLSSVLASAQTVQTFINTGRSCGKTQFCMGLATDDDGTITFSRAYQGYFTHSTPMSSFTALPVTWVQGPKDDQNNFVLTGDFVGTDSDGASFTGHTEQNFHAYYVRICTGRGQAGCGWHYTDLGGTTTLVY